MARRARFWIWRLFASLFVLGGIYFCYRIVDAFIKVILLGP